MKTPMTKNHELIQLLWISKTKASRVQRILSLNRMHNEAAAVKNRVEELDRKIDCLIAITMNDWLENSDQIINDVGLITKEVQRSINHINHNVNVVENIVKLVGFIDEIVEIVDMIT